jgi:hypothetical protein
MLNALYNPTFLVSATSVMALLLAAAKGAEIHNRLVDINKNATYLKAHKVFGWVHQAFEKNQN